ncbi:MAG: hypothetical protein Q4D79_09070 [Propionibacteriaceae bacterium]|nr:hypothetical protein [Propionibacteriaceae bacterium]
MNSAPRPLAPHQAQEAWLRQEGLALIVPGPRRVRRIVIGTAPFVVLLILLALGNDIILDLFRDGEDLESISHSQAGPALLGALLSVLSLPAAVLYHFWQRRRTHITRLIAAALVTITWLVLSIGSDFGVASRLTLLLTAGLAVYFEVPSITRWAGATVLRSLSLLGPMVAHVLPFLLLAQLLVFFTNEIWQLAYSFSKPTMWAVTGFLFAPTVVLTASQSAASLKEHLDRNALTPGVLDGTPFEDLPDLGAPRRMRLAERINLLVLPTAAQLIQVLLFIGLLTIFFVAFGSVALKPEVISMWTGSPPVRMVWLGISLPIDRTMFRVSMLLSTFSGLSFAASNITDKSYRDVFLAPIVDDMEKGLAALRRYPALHR